MNIKKLSLLLLPLSLTLFLGCDADTSKKEVQSTLSYNESSALLKAKSYYVYVPSIDGITESSSSQEVARSIQESITLSLSYNSEEPEVIMSFSNELGSVDLSVNSANPITFVFSLVKAKEKTYLDFEQASDIVLLERVDNGFMAYIEQSLMLFSSLKLEDFGEVALRAYVAKQVLSEDTLRAQTWFRVENVSTSGNSNCIRIDFEENNLVRVSSLLENENIVNYTHYELDENSLKFFNDDVERKEQIQLVLNNQISLAGANMYKSVEDVNTFISEHNCKAF